MACETRTTTINGRQYATIQLDPTKALKLEARIYPILMGGIAPLVATWGKADAVQLEAIGQATRCMVENLPPEELADLIVELCKLASCEGKRITDFDSHFTEIEDPTERYRVAMFVLEANLGGFIDALGLSGAGERALSAFKKKMAVVESKAQ